MRDQVRSNPPVHLFDAEPKAPQLTKGCARPRTNSTRDCTVQTPTCRWLPRFLTLFLAAGVLCISGTSTTASTDKPANDKPKDDKPKVDKPKPNKPAAKDAKDGKDTAKVVFPWRSDKEGNVMLLQKLRYKHEGKAQD